MKDVRYTQKPRFDPVAPFGSVIFELDSKTLVIERRYPTFVDMIAKFGGMSRVISFFIFTFVSIHHLVVMEQYILNRAIIQSQISQRKKQEEMTLTLTNKKDALQRS